MGPLVGCSAGQCWQIRKQGVGKCDNVWSAAVADGKAIGVNLTQLATSSIIEECLFRIRPLFRSGVGSLSRVTDDYDGSGGMHQAADVVIIVRRQILGLIDKDDVEHVDDAIDGIAANLLVAFAGKVGEARAEYVSSFVREIVGRVAPGHSSTLRDLSLNKANASRQDTGKRVREGPNSVCEKKAIPGHNGDIAGNCAAYRLHSTCEVNCCRFRICEVKNILLVRNVQCLVEEIGCLPGSCTGHNTLLSCH